MVRRLWLLAAIVALPFACTGEEFSSGGGGQAGVGASDGGACPPGQKTCGGACIADNLPAYGCAAASCEPCNVTNAKAKCDGAGACAVDICVGSFADCDLDATNGCEVNLNTSADCGVCGNSCPSGQVCNGGQCATGCGGLTECNGGCVDITQDIAHCGGCNQPCGAPPGTQNPVCEGASCKYDCLDEYDNCETSMSDCETSIKTDPDNCGGCSQACPDSPPGATALVCNAGNCGCADSLAPCDDPNGPLAACIDLANEPRACGSCTNACPPGHHCAGSQCKPPPACAFGLASCNSSCVSLASDPNNCGSCGKACVTGQACKQGSCVLAADCTAPYQMCTPTTVDAVVCFHPLFDAANCGSCGNACDAGNACVGGSCIPLVLTNQPWMCTALALKACAPNPNWPVPPTAQFFCHTSCPWGPPS